MENYLTVLKTSEGYYEEKRSKFISLIIPCKSEEELSKILSEIRSEHWDARHNVYAFVLSDGTARFSDDGEPHGTAGKPVFDVLTGSGIKDAVLVVTRYFGGVLLGTGGLVRAYSSAAKDAVLNAEVYEMCGCVKYSVTSPYSDGQRLERLINDCNGDITNTEYADNIIFEVSFKEEDSDNFLRLLCETFSARITAIEISKGFLPFSYKK